MNDLVKGVEHGSYGMLAIFGIGYNSLEMLGFINGYAPALGVIMTFCFGVLGVFLTWRGQRKNQSNDKQSEENKKMIAELQAKLKSINSKNSK